MNCLFCRIVKGEIPSYKIYEDDFLIAILDISQTTKGHTLVIPKKHSKNLFEIDSETYSQVSKKIPQLANALKRAFSPIGLNLVINADKPLQTIDHFHIHLLPRYQEDNLEINFIKQPAKLDSAEFQTILTRIKEVL